MNLKDRALARLASRAYNDCDITARAEGVEILTAGGVTAFRGTTLDGWDIWKDLWGIPWWDEDLGLVHRGLAEPVRQGFDRLEPHLGTTLVGHSKGGANAMAAGAIMTARGTPPARIVTFGCPSFVYWYSGIFSDVTEIDHYVYGNDPIPYHPAAGRLPGNVHFIGPERKWWKRFRFRQHRMANYTGG